MSYKIRWNGPAITAAAEAAASRGLKKGAELVLQRSNVRVPIQEGTLERSGVASVDGLRAAVSYDTPYAKRQHEDMTLRHDSGRSAKFLEKALTESGQDVLDLIAAEIRRELGT
ncbi:MAG: hypothetical protein HOQ43_10905 [Glycomyces artemisiae]|uniref:Minor capsid protein n=1 Tax=Glycomyces artemisiae TaxID=1076443 RepID=A0A850C4M6_9ACTN|nr:hypothetical protein [Glycomyces artemisiae]